MARLRAHVGAIIVGAAGVMVSGAIAGPSMSVNWVEVAVDNQDACVQRGSSAVKKNGFNTRFEVISNRTIYGERGEYTAAVRCASDHSIAFIAVAGPKSDLTDKYAKGIQGDF